MLLAKKAKIRDEKYLKEIRLQGCSASSLRGCYGDIVPAHNSFRTDAGKGTKASDCFVSPLCFGHHAEEHNRGTMPLLHCIVAEDSEQLAEMRRESQLWRYAVYLFREKHGDDINRLFREWGIK
jgi:hypothetical protein